MFGMIQNRLVQADVRFCFHYFMRNIHCWDLASLILHYPCKICFKALKIRYTFNLKEISQDGNCSLFLLLLFFAFRTRAMRCGKSFMTVSCSGSENEMKIRKESELNSRHTFCCFCYLLEETCNVSPRRKKSD